MRRYLVLLLSILVIILTGCDKTDPRVKAEGADEVAIFCGIRSYAMFSVEKKTIRAAAECFDQLTFRESELTMDVPTMFTVCFSKDSETITQISVDINGVFWLEGDTQSFVTDSGNFDYEALNQIYLKGDQIDVDAGYSYDKKEE